jgi:hypothetical protein
MEYADWEEEQRRKAEETARQQHWQLPPERIRRNNYPLEYDSPSPFVHNPLPLPRFALGQQSFDLRSFLYESHLLRPNSGLAGDSVPPDPQQPAGSMENELSATEDFGSKSIIAEVLRQKNISIGFLKVWLMPTFKDIQEVRRWRTEGINPLTAEAVKSDAEGKALRSLTSRQLAGLSKNGYYDELQYTLKAFQDERCCAVIDLDLSDPSEPRSMMAHALLGAIALTLIVDPDSRAAVFDGRKSDDARQLGPRALLYEMEPIMPPLDAAEAAAAHISILRKIAGWQRQAEIAQTCGYAMRVAMPDGDLAEWTRRNVEEKTSGPEIVIEIVEVPLGGTYAEVRANTTGGKVQHMPSVDSTKGILTHGESPAIWMYPKHEWNTQGHGRLRDVGRKWRQKDREFVLQGRFDLAMQRNIEDVRTIAGELYEVSIRQMCKQMQKQNTNQLVKNRINLLEQ